MDREISELQSAALQRIEAAKSLEELESVRVEVLGRKGSLSQFSKNFGRLTPEERAGAGRALNAAKEAPNSRSKFVNSGASLT